jgi:hypothetical protein
MHPALRAAASRRFGVFTANDALRVGYDREEVQAEVSSGRWRRLRRGVYAERQVVEAASADPVAGHRLSCVAVLVRLGTGPAISHASAARLLGLPVPRGWPDEVRLTDVGQWRRGRGYVVSRASLPRTDVVPLGPFWRTGAARTLADCAREWPLEDAVVAMDMALNGGLLAPEDLTAAVLASTHWPGIGGAARAAGLADARAESPLESLGRLRIIESGLPVPELQVELHDARGFIGRVDAWYDDAALAIEFDGLVKYESPFDGRTPGRVLWDEKRREDRMRDAGARVLRLAMADVGSGWGHAERRLLQLRTAPPTGARRFTVVRPSLKRPRAHDAAPS